MSLGSRSRYTDIQSVYGDLVPTITSLQEREIRAGLQAGGSIRGVFFVARRDKYGFEFLAYIKPSWHRIYLPLRTFGDKADRMYRDAGRLLLLVSEDFGFVGSIYIYKARAPELARFKGLRPCDAPPGGASTSDSPVPETAEEAEE